MTTRRTLTVPSATAEPTWPIDRLAYWNGETIDADDLDDEQGFHNESWRWRTAQLRVAGIAEGFAVTLGATPLSLVLGPGTAFDRAGRAVLVAPSPTVNGTPLGPSAAPGAPSSWTAAVASNGWTRSFVATEIPSEMVFLYVQFAETGVSSPAPTATTGVARYQQTPIVDLVASTSPLPPGALLLATLSVAGQSFGTISYVGRQWAGLALPAPLPPVDPSASSSSSSASPAPGPSDPTQPDARSYVRLAPIGASPSPLTIASAGAITLGATPSGDGLVDSAQPSLGLDATGRATLEAPDAIAINNASLGGLTVGPTAAPLLVANATTVSLPTGGSIGPGATPTVQVQPTSVTINGTLAAGAGNTTIRATGAVRATAPLVATQPIAVGAVGDTTGLAASGGQLALGGPNGVVLGVGSASGPNPSIAVAPSGALTVTGAVTVNAPNATKLAAPVRVTGDLALSGPVTSATFALSSLPATLNQWSGTPPTTAPIQVTTHGGALWIAIAGTLSLNSSAVHWAGMAGLTVYLGDGETQVAYTLIPWTVSPFVSIPGYLVTGLQFTLPPGQTSFVLSCDQPVENANLAGTVLELPLLRSGS